MHPAFLLAFSVLIGAPAFGIASDLAKCTESKSTIDIAACTRVIDAAQLPPKELAQAYRWRGEGFRIKDDTARALADYAEAGRLDPADAWSLIRRAGLHHAASRWSAAVADATEALNRDPESPRAYNVRGDALTQLGEYDRAIADLSETIRRDPKFRVAYINRAGAYKRSGRPDLALADYDTVTALEPDWFVGHWRRAELLVEQRRFAEALPSLTRQLEIQPTDEHYVERAQAYLALGDRNRAIADYSEAISRARDVASHRLARARLYEQNGELIAALDDYAAAFFYEPSLDGLRQLARVWLAKRRGGEKTANTGAVK